MKKDVVCAGMTDGTGGTGKDRAIYRIEAMRAVLAKKKRFGSVAGSHLFKCHRCPLLSPRKSFHADSSSVTVVPA